MQVRSQIAAMDTADVQSHESTSFDGQSCRCVDMSVESLPPLQNELEKFVPKLLSTISTSQNEALK